MDKVQKPGNLDISWLVSLWTLMQYLKPVDLLFKYQWIILMSAVRRALAVLQILQAAGWDSEARDVHAAAVYCCVVGFHRGASVCKCSTRVRLSAFLPLSLRHSICTQLCTFLLLITRLLVALLWGNDTSARIVTVVRGGRQGNRGSIAGRRRFFSPHSVRTSSWVHSAFQAVCTG
jgi:hypothetical protein